MFCSKTLYDQVEDVQVLNFWCITGSIALSVLLMIGFEYKKLTLPSKLDDILFLSTHILATGVGQVLNFALIELLSFITIGIVMNLEIPMSMLCQYTVLASNLQPIKGGMFDFIGTIIIIFGLLLPPVGELWSLKSRQKSQGEDGEEETELLPAASGAEQ